MKKLCIMAVIATMLFNVSAYATDSVISITEKKSANGLVSVTVKNNSKNDVELGMTVVKDASGVALRDKTYAALQQLAKAGETTTFTFIIPENKNGLSAAGTYLIRIYGAGGEVVEDSIVHAGAQAIADFIELMKTEFAKVQNPAEAYKTLEVLINDTDNRAVVLSLGVDYDSFSSESSAVQNDTLNILYAAGSSVLDKESFPKAFEKAYGTAIYNSGKKTDGMLMFDLVYDDEAADDELFSAAASAMASTYKSINAFEEDFVVAYGIETINHATVDTLGKVLDAFVEETGLYEEAIGDIKGLASTKRYVAYEYIISSVSSKKLTSKTQLETLLEAAYGKATKKTNLGGGNGGGMPGNSANMVTSGTGVISVTQGPGGTDEKVGASAIFPDLLTEHWAAESVEYLKKLGIINGNENGEFEPDRAVTREEFTKMLVLVCGLEIDGKDTDFVDAEPDAWYRAYIGAATENGLVNGTGNNLFGIGATITRQDMAVMVARAMRVKGIESVEMREYISFADEDKVADYAAGEIKMLYKAGVINGKGENFDPVGSASRAEAAKIIYEAFKGGN